MENIKKIYINKIQEEIDEITNAIEIHKKNNTYCEYNRGFLDGLLCIYIIMRLKTEGKDIKTELNKL